MKAIVSVFARDSRGITAYVTSLLAERDINILDISQTLMQEYFAMIMLVDLEACPLPFHELAEWLKRKGEERALDIHIQRSDIFEAMHRI
ncbi:MAG: ACT domain-containing protein [Oscillospiraceae bacterium]|nr:ACT domain-containing protein [Oscillospiraceae bacterium]